MKNFLKKFFLNIFCFQLFVLCVLILSSVAANGADFLNANYDELTSDQKEEWLRLLHYKNGKSLTKAPSTFFLSESGNVDPKAEYELSHSVLLSDSNEKCKFPARYTFLTNKTVSLNECPDYKTYRDNINIDNVYYVIANEVTLNLISQMGHSFILIDVTTENGKHPQYIVSYAADTTQEISSYELIWNFLTRQISGKYFLRPYSGVLKEYVDAENRSLWKYRIKLTKEEKEYLTAHLYELKGHEVIYSIFDNNCSNGAEIFFASTSDKFLSDSFSFDTPISYAQYLYKHDLIDKIQIVPGALDQMSLDNNNVRNPLEHRKPSRFAISYLSGRHIDALEFSYSPIFKNLNDDNRGTFEISNNEVFKFTGRYDFRDNRLFIKKFDVLNFGLIANGILDAAATKRFELSFTGNEFDNHTRLYPQVLYGLGYSRKFANFYPYFSANVGVHFDRKSVFGIGGEIGFFVNDRKFGKFHLFYNQMLTNTGEWNGLKYYFEAGWSKLLFDDFSLDLKYRGGFDKHNKRYSDYFSLGFVYTF